MKLRLFFVAVAAALLLSPASRAVAAERLFAVPVTQGNVITELNPDTGAEINRFASPEPVSGAGGPDGLAFDGVNLWFINGFGTDRLWRLNPNNGSVIGFTALASGDYDGIAALNGKIYIQQWVNNDIVEFDPSTNTVTNVLDIDGANPGIDDLHGGLAGAGNVLVSIVNFSTVVVINPGSGIIVSSFPAGPGSNAGVAVLGGEIYIGEISSTQIQVFSMTGTVIRSFNAPYAASALGGDQVDSDGDGVPDASDECPNSDLRPKVDTGSGPTSVDNVSNVDGNGCSIQDLVKHCAEDATNHGEYVACIAQLAAQLRSAGVITGREHGELVSGAAKSSIGK